MKAVICTKYGPPEVLKLSEVERPIPTENEMLVKVFATAATVSDTIIRSLNVPGGHAFPIEHFMKFVMRTVIGFNKPRNPILGLVFSGVVESVGENIKAFEKGDKVFGFTGQSRGSYAEYKCVTNKEIASGEVILKPKKASHEEAAAIIYGGILVMHFMNIDLSKGQKVLIYGASGAIGSIAVQYAKYLGTEVTAVCSDNNFELVTSLGADKVIDYTTQTSGDQLEQYDLVFDAVGKNKSSEIKKKCQKSITRNGRYVSVDDGFLKLKPEYLSELNSLIENDHIKAVIDREFDLADIVEAHKYVDLGHKKGNVIIQVNQNQ
jgi:NADPH:quinone reductase-like Zn-dependent oxidoreductase